MEGTAAALVEIDKVLDIQRANGNWNYDAYMLGLANGLILARACVSGETPEFLTAPKAWLADSELTEAPTAVSTESV